MAQRNRLGSVTGLDRIVNLKFQAHQPDSFIRCRTHQRIHFDGQCRNLVHNAVLAEESEPVFQNVGKFFIHPYVQFLLSLVQTGQSPVYVAFIVFEKRQLCQRSDSPRAFPGLVVPFQ